MYRELTAATQFDMAQENIVRYFTSWFEELDKNEKLTESEYRDQYSKLYQKKMRKSKHKKMKSISSASSLISFASSKESESFNTKISKSMRRLSFGKSKLNDIKKSVIAPPKYSIKEAINEDEDLI